MRKNRRENHKWLYIAVTADKYEFIIDFFYSLPDFAKWAGVSYDTIARNLRIHRKLKKMNCYCEKVSLQEPEPELEILDLDDDFNDF